MKTLLIFIFGVAVGVVALRTYNQRNETAGSAKDSPQVTDHEPGKSKSVIDDAKDAAVDAKDRIAKKLSDWHLTADDIRSDLEQTGRVVRVKAHEAGASIAAATSNARVIATIKTKLALEKDLSARKIGVDCTEGKVTLSGTVQGPALIGKAIALALDTDGVREVTSLLTAEDASK